MAEHKQDDIPQEIHLATLGSPRFHLTTPQTPRASPRGNIEDVHPQSPRFRQKRFCDVLDQCISPLRSRVLSEYSSSTAAIKSTSYDLISDPPQMKESPLQGVHVADTNETMSIASSELSYIPGRCSLMSIETSCSSPARNSSDKVVQRWGKLCSLIMSPGARLALSSTFQVHETWSQYLDALRANQGNSQTVYAVAKMKISAQRTSHNDIKDRPLLQIPISLPNVSWRVITFMCLLYDSVTLPMNASFDVEDSQIHIILSCITHVFFVLDIIMNFILGWETLDGVEKRPRKIASLYARSWLCFDLVLIFLDWIVFALDIMRTGLKAAELRVLRLFRLLRLLKIHRMLRGPILYISRRALVTSGLVESLVGYALYVHFSSCAWFAVKKSGDSTWANGCPAQDIAHCYFAALHWALDQLHGVSYNSYSTLLEWIFAAISSLVGMLLFALLLTQVVSAATFLTGNELNVENLRQRCIAYARRRNISDGLSYRLLRYTSTGGSVSIGKSVQEEADHLHSLPQLLRGEALYETRIPLICCVRFIKNLEYISKQLLMQLCTDALDFAVHLSGEIIFTHGDTATSWRTVDAGRLLYLFEQEDPWNVVSHKVMSKPLRRLLSRELGLVMTPRQTESFEQVCTFQSFSEDESGKYRVGVGANICEMVMWTPWEHIGDLYAIEDSVLLQMSFSTFCRSLAVRQEACLLAAGYAQQYVSQLNSMSYDMSDILQISPGLQDDGDDQDSDLPRETSHLIFLSHYKVEAGTEATLLQEALQQMIVRDSSEMHRRDAGVFLDSENLSQLGDLKDHVIGSKNVVLLLTPSVLLRPWCILEIVIAMENNVKIVPVEIQRPGMKFTYPGEQFYTKLRRGALLKGQDVQLLENEGITLPEVENALRFVFKQIAISFSPHKSKNIREAELSDIMNRCMPDQPKTPRRNSLSTTHPLQMLQS